MKNISIILNIVLLVAVAVLYYLHFSSGKPAAANSTGSSDIPSNIKIAYVNSDTLSKYYDYLKDTREIMEAKANRLDSDFKKRAQGLQNEIAAYQRNVNSMTVGQLKATEEDLARKQQNLQMFQQSLSQEVMRDEARINQELYDKVTSYLAKYGNEKGLQVILKYDPSSDVLHASNALDVTQEVLNGLNQEYKANKPGAKTDSASVKK
jgi:outer membrane protein